MLAPSFTISIQQARLPWLLLGLVAVLLGLVYRRVRLNPALSSIPGPASAHWLLGNEWELYNASAGAVWRRWIASHGTILRYRNAFWNGSTILVADPAAIRTILAQDGYTFHKPPFNRQTNQRLLGEGVIWAEGDAHRKQRRLLSPAFTTPSTKLMSPAFYNTAEDVKTAWTGLLASQPTVVLNVAEWMSSAALDVIGATGFRHQFRAVTSKSLEASRITDGLNKALGSRPTFRTFLSLNLAKSFPTLFNHAPLPALRAQRQSKASIDAVAYQLLEQAEEKDKEENKSIITMLLSGRKQGDGLTDREIVDNVATMITAGHETTGITLSMILYELSRDQALQNRLRGELTVHGQVPSYDKLQKGAAPLLDAIIQEVVRIYPANIRIIRRADENVLVPVSTPFKTHNGDLATSFIVPAGTDVIFPITSINTLPSLWGPDGEIFRPVRWLEKDGIPDSAKDVPGGFFNTFTFISGPRACLGMKFAISEIRVIVSQLITSFSLHPPYEGAPAINVVSPAQIMMRGEHGVPILIRPITY